MAQKCLPQKLSTLHILVANAVFGHFFLCVINVTLPFKDREFKEVMDGRWFKVGRIKTWVILGP